MSLPVVYHNQIPDEINAAVAWYEQQRTGRGSEFMADLQEQLTRIADTPLLYGVLDRQVRGCPMRHFPYVVYYRLESSRIVIIAVQHGARDPRSWRRRA
jgi:plasmid stabilization system protein ParE